MSPAVSRSQRRFMGAVQGYKNGKLNNPSPEIKQAAATMKSGDVHDFASTSEKGLPDKVSEVTNFLETIGRYNEYGKMLKRDTALQEIGQQLASIAEMAEQAVVNEADDWFDKHTVSRNMKEIKSYSGDFMKLAKEADTINQRMTALYDDMGRILERYFEIPDLEEPAIDDDEITQRNIDAAKDNEREVPDHDPDPNIEDDGPHGPNVDKAVAENSEIEAGTTKDAVPLEPVHSDTPLASKKGQLIDALTLKAIKTVHDNLKQKNPELARRFKNLPPHKMKECVWKMVR